MLRTIVITGLAFLGILCITGIPLMAQDIHPKGPLQWTVKNWIGILDWGKDWWSDNGAANLSATLIWHHETGLLSTIRLAFSRTLSYRSSHAFIWIRIH